MGEIKKTSSKKTSLGKTSLTFDTNKRKGNVSKSISKTFTYSKSKPTIYEPPFQSIEESKAKVKSKITPMKSTYKSTEKGVEYGAKSKVKIKSKNGKTKAITKVNGKKTKDKWQTKQK